MPLNAFDRSLAVEMLRPIAPIMHDDSLKEVFRAFALQRGLNAAEVDDEFVIAQASLQPRLVQASAPVLIHTHFPRCRLQAYTHAGMYTF